MSEITKQLTNTRAGVADSDSANSKESSGNHKPQAAKSQNPTTTGGKHRGHRDNASEDNTMRREDENAQAPSRINPQTRASGKKLSTHMTHQTNTDTDPLDSHAHHRADEQNYVPTRPATKAGAARSGRPAPYEPIKPTVHANRMRGYVAAPMGNYVISTEHLVWVTVIDLFRIWLHFTVNHGCDYPTEVEFWEFTQRYNRFAQPLVVGMTGRYEGSFREWLKDEKKRRETIQKEWFANQDSITDPNHNDVRSISDFIMDMLEVESEAGNGEALDPHRTIKTRRDLLFSLYGALYNENLSTIDPADVSEWITAHGKARDAPAFAYQPIPIQPGAMTLTQLLRRQSINRTRTRILHPYEADPDDNYYGAGKLGQASIMMIAPQPPTRAATVIPNDRSELLYDRSDFTLAVDPHKITHKQRPSRGNTRHQSFMEHPFKDQTGNGLLQHHDEMSPPNQESANSFKFPTKPDVAWIVEANGLPYGNPLCRGTCIVWYTSKPTMSDIIWKSEPHMRLYMYELRPDDNEATYGPDHLRWVQEFKESLPAVTDSDGHLHTVNFYQLCARMRWYEGPYLPEYMKLTPQQRQHARPIGELLSCTSGTGRGNQLNKPPKSSLHCYLDLPVPGHIIQEYVALALNQRAHSRIEGNMYSNLPSLETTAITNDPFWTRREGNATTYAPTWVEIFHGGYTYTSMMNIHIQMVATFLKYSARSQYYKELQADMTLNQWSDEKENNVIRELQLRAPAARAGIKSVCTLMKEVLHYHQRFCRDNGERMRVQRIPFEQIHQHTLNKLLTVQRHYGQLPDNTPRYNNGSADSRTAIDYIMGWRPAEVTEYIDCDDDTYLPMTNPVENIKPYYEDPEHETRYRTTLSTTKLMAGTQRTNTSTRVPRQHPTLHRGSRHRLLSGRWALDIPHYRSRSREQATPPPNAHRTAAGCGQRGRRR